MEALNELIRILDREAVVADHVLFRLKGLELLLAAGEHRFLPDASEELDEAIDRMGALETMRALASDEVGEALGLEPGTCTLSDVLRVADDRQRANLLRAQVRLRGLLAEMDELAALDRDLALARVAEVRAAIERLVGVRGARYGRDGIVAPSRGPASGTFDEKL